MAESQQAQQTVEDLGKLVKSKYPDAYGSLSDIEVGRKVKAKYPQYSQFTDITAKPKLTPKSPKETQEILQGRYGNILKRNADPSNFGVAKEALIGAGKTAARDALQFADIASIPFDPVGNIQRLRGKRAASVMDIAPGEPEGPGQEFGSLAVTSAEIVPAVVSLTGIGIKTVSRILSQPGGAAKLWELAHVVRHPISSAAFKTLKKLLTSESEAVEATVGKGTRVKYGGPTAPFDEGARRLAPRKPAPLPEAEKFEPFRPNPKTAAKLRSGG